MSRHGLLIGEVTKRTRATWKALRLYEEAGILLAPRRTTAGYRVYGPGSGLRFEDRGVRALKGIPGEWRLFAVARG